MFLNSERVSIKELCKYSDVSIIRNPHLSGLIIFPMCTLQSELSTAVVFICYSLCRFDRTEALLHRHCR